MYGKLFSIIHNDYQFITINCTPNIDCIWQQLWVNYLSEILCTSLASRQYSKNVYTRTGAVGKVVL